jgi:hypothetical protein
VHGFETGVYVTLATGALLLLLALYGLLTDRRRAALNTTERQPLENQPHELCILEEAA